jgi:sucrose-6-phosphate hydrolase SacC (GH32 family)
MTYGLNIGDDQIGYTIRNNSFIYNDESMIFKYLPELAAKKIGWEIIVDKTSIEVFIDSGRFTMVLPRELESNENALEFWSDNGSELKINALEVYEMKSIWK